MAGGLPVFERAASAIREALAQAKKLDASARVLARGIKEELGRNGETPLAIARGRDLVAVRAKIDKLGETVSLLHAAAELEKQYHFEAAQKAYEAAVAFSRMPIKIQLPWGTSQDDSLGGLSGGIGFIDSMNNAMVSNAGTITGAMGTLAGSVVPGLGSAAGGAFGQAAGMAVQTVAQASPEAGAVLMTGIVAGPVGAAAQGVYQLHKAGYDDYLVGAAAAGPIGVGAVGAYHLGKAAWDAVFGESDAEKQRQAAAALSTINDAKTFCAQFPSECTKQPIIGQGMVDAPKGGLAAAKARVAAGLQAQATATAQTSSSLTTSTARRALQAASKNLPSKRASSWPVFMLAGALGVALFILRHES